MNLTLKTNATKLLQTLLRVSCFFFFLNLNRSTHYISVAINFEQVIDLSSDKYLGGGKWFNKFVKPGGNERLYSAVTII